MTTQTGGRGRLSRLVATRGGKAAPEKPFVIEHREALIYMLCEAAELEHGIMCQYLFAAFSLKQDTGEGLTADQLAAVDRWRKQVSHVATQEMLHLSLVQNLLSAIGAAPHMSRPNLPAPAGQYPAGVRLALLPFGEQALRHFMFLERPEGMDLDDADGLAAMDAAVPVMHEGDIVPYGQDFATVGHLYRSIEAGFEHLAAKYGEDWLFTGPPRAQATERHFGWRELIAVTDLASARRAIEEILEQGEGPRGHWRHAHFGQFVAILDEYQRMRRASPGFEPARPVVAANVRPHERTGDVPLITDPVTAQACDLFNVGYEVLLQVFQRFFAHTTESDAQLTVLADATLALMLRVIKPLGALLTTLPAGPQHPGRAAAPSFELFYESDYLIPHQHAAWAMLAERLDVASRLCQGLCGASDALNAQLSPVTAALGEIATTLAAHLPPGTPQAAIGSPHSVPGQASAALTRTKQLLDDASRSAAALQASQLTELAAAAGAAADLGTERAASAVWDTAQAVTGLRASLGKAGSCPPELAEAAAALQDLALRLAPAGEHQARLDRLWKLQAGLVPSVQPVPGGPYLATNVPALTDPLGSTARPAPQLALCRCGESAVKPGCDGACERSGFRDAKDPNRVPDRRDTYHGQQVTVFDNRGICQHSGFCTDRLPGVFRAGGEPFVAASGGRLDEVIRAVRDCPSGALSYALGGREARRHADWDHARAPAIEITADGPYRVTGALPLTGPGGEPVARAEGSSAEHYALCRCGHSQNKPFCSGMHWYVQFRDPVPSASPTLFEYAGGMGPLARAARLLYEKHIPADPVLAPVYAQMPPDQPLRLAAWLAAAFGGGAAAAKGSPSSPRKARVRDGGGHGRIVMENPALPPDGEPLTAEQAARWAMLAGRAADDAKLPADPGFRAAWSSCAEWVSRTASQPGPAVAAPVPHWDWPAGPPPLAADETAAEAVPVTLPGPGEPVSFETHIKPLFRERDRRSMSFAFDLWAAGDVQAHAEGILARLEDGTMPCDGAWPAERTEVFRRWAQTGMQP